jgi:hypothetical protein
MVHFEPALQHTGPAGGAQARHRRMSFSRRLAVPNRLAAPGLAVLLLAVDAASIRAQQLPAPPAGQQREHVVRRGDTLWDLARQYLHDPFLWPVIFEANRDRVRDPHWIYPADRLVIPELLRRPLDQPVEPYPRAPELQPPPAGEPPPADTVPMRLATIDMRRPVMTGDEYVRMPWLSAAADPGLVGRIVERADAAARQDRLASALYPHERVHLALRAPVAAGDTLVAVRTGRRIAGHTVIEPVALLRVDSVHATGATARIVSQFGGTRTGDVVMARPPVPDFPAGAAAAVETGPQGRILEFLRRAPMHGTTDLAFVSLGRRDGIGIGDEFGVYVAAGAGRPETRVGTLRIVHVGEATATARVIGVTGTGLQDGLPIRLVGRVP